MASGAQQFLMTPPRGTVTGHPLTVQKQLDGLRADVMRMHEGVSAKFAATDREIKETIQTMRSTVDNLNAQLGTLDSRLDAGGRHLEDTISKQVADANIKIEGVVMEAQRAFKEHRDTMSQIVQEAKNQKDTTDQIVAHVKNMQEHTNNAMENLRRELEHVRSGGGGGAGGR